MTENARSNASANASGDGNKNASAESDGSADGDPGDSGASTAAFEESVPSPVPTDVPEGERPAATCQYCGRPFRTERRYWLHVGEAHADETNEAERSATERAVGEEGDDLFVYHLKVIAWLVVLLFFYIYTYALVWSPVY